MTNTHPYLCRRLAALVCVTLIHSASGTVLFSDNFNAPDSTSFDAAEIAGRRSGVVANETFLRSWGVQQHINNNQVLFHSGNSGGIRFENALNEATGAADRYDWAAGGAAASIIAAGGFTVSFDWYVAENTLTSWVSYQVGTINGDTPNLTHADTDYGILFRNNGATERFDNSENKGPGGNFTATTAETVRQVAITYSFGSFADGTSVNAVSTVNGVEVANDTFTWQGNAGTLFMEMGSISANSRIDNLTIATIPEPSLAALGGLSAIGFLARRRR